jgi:multicomponent Na+:H+ antiporter subunit D
MQEQLPALQIVMPLVAAPICVLLRRPLLTYVFSVVVSWAVFANAVALLLGVMEKGVISYEMGGWMAPWGIEYRVDTLGAFMLLFVSAIGALVLTYAPPSLGREIPRDHHYLFLAAYLLCLTGLLGIIITGDLFNMFVFLEISALSSYVLISLGKDRRALTAAFQYLVMGTLGATFILIGIGLMYMMTGTLNMMDMAGRLVPVLESRTVLTAFGFLTIGIFLKMALFPLHAWLPNAYCYAPSVVTSFLAATATKVSVYILLRIVFTVYGMTFSTEVFRLEMILLPLALLGIFVTSTVAIFQRNIKRMLAYSSLAQIGYMVLGISFASVYGLTAGIVHMFNHALMKGGLFLAMGAIALRIGSVSLDDMRGLGRQMPVTMAAWVVGGLGIIGVPLTAGFISKWYLILAAIDSGSWPVAALILISSLLALVYIWRVVEAAYFRPPPASRPKPAEAPLPMLIVIWLMVGATLLFGVWTSLSAGLARRAAEFLLEAGG